MWLCMARDITELQFVDAQETELRFVFFCAVYSSD